MNDRPSAASGAPLVLYTLKLKMFGFPVQPLEHFMLLNLKINLSRASRIYTFICINSPDGTSKSAPSLQVPF